MVAFEHTAWNMRDRLEDIVIELQPLGKLNLKFEAAFGNSEFVSRRYPLQFNGIKRLDQKLFIDGWRRMFVLYSGKANNNSNFFKIKEQFLFKWNKDITTNNNEQSMVDLFS